MHAIFSGCCSNYFVAEFFNSEVVSVERRTSLPQIGSEISSIPSSNNILTCTNKGMETESQDELGQYIKVDAVPESDNCEKDGSLECEKSHYQSLKDSDTARLSVYETLVREYPKLNVSIPYSFCMNMV